MRVFENRVLRGKFPLRREVMAAEWGNSVVRGFITCTLYHTLLGLLEK
jgi:hypothetical protein